MEKFQEEEKVKVTLPFKASVGEFSKTYDQQLKHWEQVGKEKVLPTNTEDDWSDYYLNQKLNLTK